MWLPTNVESFVKRNKASLTNLVVKMHTSVHQEKPYSEVISMQQLYLL